MRYAEQKFGCFIVADAGESIDDCDRTQTISLLSEQGWLLFRDFKPSVDDFAKFSSSFGRCTPVRRAPTSSTAIDYHAEDSYNPFRPDALWFHCVEVGSDEGASTYVCDGEKLFQILPTSLKEALDGKYLRFDRLYSKHEWQKFTLIEDKEDLAQSLASVPELAFKFTSDDSLYLGFEVPVLSKVGPGRLAFANTMLHGWTEPDFYGMSFSDGSNIPHELIREIDSVARSIETGIQWKKGDIALLDNRRLLHRRGEYHGKGRDLCVTNCENFFGSQIIEISSPNAVQIKQLIQGETGNPVRAGWDMAQSLDRAPPIVSQHQPSL